MFLFCFFNVGRLTKEEQLQHRDEAQTQTIVGIVKKKEITRQYPHYRQAGTKGTNGVWWRAVEQCNSVVRPSGRQENTTRIHPSAPAFWQENKLIESALQIQTFLQVYQATATDSEVKRVCVCVCLTWWKRTLVLNTLVLHFIFPFILLADYSVCSCCVSYAVNCLSVVTVSPACVSCSPLWKRIPGLHWLI